MLSFSGTRPTNLGVKDGKLADCPETPNCVSSQADPSDSEHYIQGFPCSMAAPDVIAKLKSIVESMERTEIINATDTYLYAEFTSKLMGYVDDVEFYVDASKSLVHVRSASRLGRSDLGVNRKRIESIRSAFV